MMMCDNHSLHSHSVHYVCLLFLLSPSHLSPSLKPFSLSLTFLSLHIAIPNFLNISSSSLLSLFICVEKSCITQYTLKFDCMIERMLWVTREEKEHWMKRERERDWMQKSWGERRANNLYISLTNVFNNSVTTCCCLTMEEGRTARFLKREKLENGEKRLEKERKDWEGEKKELEWIECELQEKRNKSDERTVIIIYFSCTVALSLSLCLLSLSCLSISLLFKKFYSFFHPHFLQGLSSYTDWLSNREISYFLLLQKYLEVSLHFIFDFSPLKNFHSPQSLSLTSSLSCSLIIFSQSVLMKVNKKSFMPPFQKYVYIEFNPLTSPHILIRADTSYLFQKEKNWCKREILKQFLTLKKTHQFSWRYRSKSKKVWEEDKLKKLEFWGKKWKSFPVTRK